MGENKVFDTKLTKGLPQWDGDRQKLRHWSAKVEGYIAALDPALHGLMEIAATKKEPIKHSGLRPEHIELSTKLWGVLGALMPWWMGMRCRRSSTARRAARRDAHVNSKRKENRAGLRFTSDTLQAFRACFPWC